MISNPVKTAATGTGALSARHIYYFSRLSGTQTKKHETPTSHPTTKTQILPAASPNYPGEAPIILGLKPKPFTKQFDGLKLNNVHMTGSQML